MCVSSGCSRHVYKGWETLVRLTHLSVMKFSVDAHRGGRYYKCNLRRIPTDGCCTPRGHLTRHGIEKTRRERASSRLGERSRNAAGNFNRPSKYYSSTIKSSLKLLFSFPPFFLSTATLGHRWHWRNVTFEYFRNPWRIPWICPVVFWQKISAKIEARSREKFESLHRGIFF